MPYRTLRLTTAITAALLLPTTLQAGILSSLHPRAMAMGGVGIALPDPALSPLINPAGLALIEADDTVSVALPQFGVKVYDPDSMLDTIDRLQGDNDNGTIQALADAIDRANQYSTRTILTEEAFTEAAAAYDDIALKGEVVNRDLIQLDSAPLFADLAATVALAVPSPSWGYALHLGAGGRVGGYLLYRDANTFDNLLDDVGLFANCLRSAPSNNASTIIDACNNQNYTYINPAATEVDDIMKFDTDDDIKSEINARGYLISEIGVSLANQYIFNGRQVAIGITPKSWQVSAIHYRATVQDGDFDSDTLDSDDYLAEHNAFNLDLGMMMPLDDQITVGVAIQNLIPQSFDYFNQTLPAGVSPGSLEIDPMITAGIAYRGNGYTLAADLDLTEDKGFEGLDGSRVLGLGGEINGWRYVQLRAGYRTDLSQSGRDSLSLGLGLRIGLELDLAAVASDNELGGAMRLGFGW